MKHLLLFLLLLASPLRAQERAVTARIVDAETGEGLPFAKIYVSPEKGTMTNDEGDFLLSVAPADTLRITFIGYEKQHLAAGKLPPVIRLRRLAYTMTEVTVMGDDLMERIEKQLHRIYKKNRKRKSRYFMRQTNVLTSGPQMVEAYIEARPAVNLRNISFLSGRHFKEGKRVAKHDFEGFDEAEEVEMMQFSNAHLLLSLGPLVMDEKAWAENIITPFNILPWGIPRLNRGQKFNERGYEQHYSIRVGVLKEKDGREILRVELEGTPEEYPQLCGVLHVDAKTLNPLSFDGYIKGHEVNINNTKEVPAKIEFHIRYDDDKKRPLISQITATIKAPGLECRTLLFRTDRKNISSRKSDKGIRNMLEAIREVGYDPELWKDPIVKHTLEEERLMTGKKP